MSLQQQILPGCSYQSVFISSAFLILQTWIHMLVIVGSILSYFFFALVFGAMCVTCNPPSNPYWIMQEHMLDPVFYLVCVLTTCVALLPRYDVYFIKRVSEVTGLEFIKRLLRIDSRPSCLVVEKSQSVLVKVLVLTPLPGNRSGLSK